VLFQSFAGLGFIRFYHLKTDLYTHEQPSMPDCPELAEWAVETGIWAASAQKYGKSTRRPEISKNWAELNMEHNTSFLTEKEALAIDPPTVKTHVEHWHQADTLLWHSCHAREGEDRPDYAKLDSTMA
jgi:hypothetical protein